MAAEHASADGHTGDGAAVHVGRFMYPSSSATYEGQYRVLHGVNVAQGKGKYVDGHASYEGDFDNNQFHGHGRYIGASGAVYEGDFVAGQFSGRGRYKYPDGAEYVGEWHLCRMHGKGAFSAADGVQYVGEFYNGLYVSGTTHVAVR